MTRIPRRWLAAGALLWLAAACSDSSGPGRLSDPAALTAELASLDSTFATQAFESFSAVASLINPTAAGLSGAALTLEATRPTVPAAGQSGYVRTALRAQKLRQLLPSAATLATSGFLPDTIKGTTFEWDTASNSYVATARAGADTAGVRFILYAVDLSGTILEPVVEVGHLDLIDRSTTSSLRMQILVQGVGGTPTFVDYLATITPGVSSLRASVAGSISNGQSGGANKTLGFSVTVVATPGAVTETASFSLNNPSVSVSLSVTITDTNTGFEIVADFRFTRPGETIQLAGLLTFTETTPGQYSFTAVDAAVRVNGATYATIQGDPNAAQWVKADGTPLTLAELDALDDLGEAVEHFLDFAEDLFEPIENLFGN